MGRDPTSSKYELHVRLRTLRNGPALRNRLRLPHPVKTDIRICVIAAPDSKAAAEARAEGATLVGEEEVFEHIREGKLDFDRCICHIDSLPKLGKANVARILGPKGFMPSAKTGTVVTRVGQSVRDMVSANEYREKMAVVRMAVGQLAFTPEEMQENVLAFMSQVKADIAKMKGKINKEVHEVVRQFCGRGRSLMYILLTRHPRSSVPQTHRASRSVVSFAGQPRSRQRTFQGRCRLSSARSLYKYNVPKPATHRCVGHQIGSFPSCLERLENLDCLCGFLHVCIQFHDVDNAP